MQENLYKCDNCGAEYTEWHNYCRKCHEPLPKKVVVVDEKLEGESKEEIYEFIGSNQSRYYKIFKEHEGKFKFNHMNWAAFIFTTNWMFFRKMYKNAINLILISIGIAMAAVFLSLVITIPTFVQLDKELGVYSDYVTQDSINYDWFKDEALDAGEYMQAKIKYDQTMNFINIISNLFVFVPGILLNLYIGLRADSMYKKHVFKNIASKDKGGTSIGAVVLAAIIGPIGVSILTGIASKLLLFLIYLIF